MADDVTGTRDELTALGRERAALRQAESALNLRVRPAVLQALAAGLDPEQIAGLVGLTAGTIKAWRAHARQR